MSEESKLFPASEMSADLREWVSESLEDWISLWDEDQNYPDADRDDMRPTWDDQVSVLFDDVLERAGCRRYDLPRKLVLELRHRMILLGVVVPLRAEVVSTEPLSRRVLFTQDGVRYESP